MHDQETQQKFVTLRAQGRSFSRIATELNVARRTLVDWSRKFQFEIQNQRAIELEALQEKYLATREERLARLGGQLAAVEAELKQRSIAELSTPRLFALADSLRRQLLREAGDNEVRFSSPVEEIPKDEFHEQAQDWAA
jgi:hypothetical protein